MADDLPTVLNLQYESDTRCPTRRAEGEEWSDEASEHAGGALRAGERSDRERQ